MRSTDNQKILHPIKFINISKILQVSIQVKNMLAPPPPAPPPPKRNIKPFIIAAIVIVGVVAVVLAVSIMFPAFDFKITAVDYGGSAAQGSNAQTRIQIDTVTGVSQEVTLSADSGSSGIVCSFSPASTASGSSSVLTLTVPSSTATKAYSITITAEGGGKSHSTAYTLAVLSAYVDLSGTVEASELKVNMTSIEFLDTQTGLTYQEPILRNCYHISLENQHSYNVTVTWEDELGVIGIFDAGTVNVIAPVGSTTMTKNFGQPQEASTTQ
jgi:hypothetical protein